MNNLKISKKLLISFAVVILLSIVVGVIGITGMTDINDASTGMYEHQSRPLPLLAHAIENVQYLRLHVKELEVRLLHDEHHYVPEVLRSISSTRATLVDYLDQFERTVIAGGEIDRTFTEIRQTLDRVYFPFLDGIAALANAGDRDRLIAETDAVEDAIAGVNARLRHILDLRVEMAAQANADNDALFSRMLTIIVVVLVFSLIVAVLFIFVVSNSISKPLKEYDEWMRLTAKGDIVWRPEEIVILDKYKVRKDEVGTLVASYAALVDYLGDICDKLKKVASGDLSFDVTPYSDNDLLAVNVKKMVADLNSMFYEVNHASGLVQGSSRQIADGAQSLAQGSTEQAATVQQLSAAISEISSKTKANSDMASRAAALAGDIMSSAEKGSGQMNEMMAAVTDINQASQSISKVIKVIDDIAFQTNILALNAAVEAARAGQHGKGFAVVAEEVRNLAAKSAEAARDTGGLIASSMEKAELGAKIAKDTAASLEEIVSGINESNKLVSDIATSSQDQSRGILEINSGIDQVAQVVSQNSATAQESAASAHELSGQSDVLEDLISRFTLKNDGSKKLGKGKLTTGSTQHFNNPTPMPTPTAAHEASDLDFTGFGKY